MRRACIIVSRPYKFWHPLYRFMTDNVIPYSQGEYVMTIEQFLDFEKLAEKKNIKYKFYFIDS